MHEYVNLKLEVIWSDSVPLILSHTNTMTVDALILQFLLHFTLRITNYPNAEGFITCKITRQSN